VNCCTKDLVYKLVTTVDTSGCAPTEVTASLYTITDYGTTQKELKILDRATLDTEGDYYIFVTNEGSANIKSPKQCTFSPKIKWKIVCGPNSVTI
jgi:hypothetical protein